MQNNFPRYSFPATACSCATSIVGCGVSLGSVSSNASWEFRIPIQTRYGSLEQTQYQRKARGRLKQLVSGCPRGLRLVVTQSHRHRSLASLRSSTRGSTCLHPSPGQALEDEDWIHPRARHPPRQHRSRCLKPYSGSGACGRETE